METMRHTRANDRCLTESPTPGAPGLFPAWGSGFHGSFATVRDASGRSRDFTREFFDKEGHGPASP